MVRFCPLDIVPFVTLGLTLFTTVFSFYVWNEDKSLQSVAFCGFEKQKNFLYQAFASNFSHITYLHLALNMFFLLDVGFNLEKQLGSFGFAFLYGLSILGVIVLECIYHAFIYSGCSVGASAVLFSIFTFWCYNCEGDLLLWGIVSINPVHMPWIVLITCQLLFWSSAFGMHTCGIVFGIITYYMVPKSLWDAMKCGRDSYRETIHGDGFDNGYSAESIQIAPTGIRSFENKTHQHSLV